MAHFIREGNGEEKIPPLPFLCLLVSGGNSQIVKVNAYNDMEVLGQTIDDAAGEAIDKCSKVMGLGYPGGPIIDRLARQGNPQVFHFAEPSIPGLDYSFSGLKTSFLYSMQKWVAEDPDFVPRPYYQVYQQKHGFLPNLSILDLLFNMGPESILFIKKGLNIIPDSVSL